MARPRTWTSRALFVLLALAAMLTIVGCNKCAVLCEKAWDCVPLSHKFAARGVPYPKQCEATCKTDTKRAVEIVRSTCRRFRQ